MSGDLEDKVAIITGGASGIGKGMVRRFAAEGAKVVIADLNEDQGHALQGEIGRNAAFLKTDVADPEAIRALIAITVETFGGLHVMANNAGMSGKRSAHFLDEDFADFQRVMAVNLLGVMVGTREAARHMAEHGGGSIINTSSIGGMQPAAGLWAYNATKAAVIHFTKSVAIALGPHGVRCNVISPGNIETPIMAANVAGHLTGDEKAEVMKKVRAFLIGRQPLQIQGVPEDTAQAALFLASDRSRYITGMVIPVDGGQICGTPNTSALFRESIER